MERKNAWLSYGESDEKEMEKLAKDYRAFLDAGKTERECVTELVREAEANGYVSLEAKQAAGEKIQPGDKVYAVGMKKIMALFHIGEDPMEKGMNILGAHIDSPRLDVKQNPLYEDTDLAYLDTHYYGGVKKYHWVALPLAIHGVIVKKDGTVVNVTVAPGVDILTASIGAGAEFAPATGTSLAAAQTAGIAVTSQFLLSRHSEN